MSNWKKGIIAGLLTQVLWGIAGPLVKIGLTSIPPISLLFFRSLGVCLILLPYYERWVHQHQEQTQPSNTNPVPVLAKEDRWPIFWAGFLGTAVNISFYFWAQKLTSVSDAWIIGSTGTIFIVMFCYLFEKERLGSIVYTGIALAFIGTLLIIGTPILQVGSGNIFGNILMLIATFGGAGSFIFIKKLAARYDPLVLTFYFFLISLIFTTPMFIFEFLQNPLWIASLSLGNIMIIVYEILFASIAAYAFTNISLKHLSASIAATIGYASTAIAILLAIIFLHEKLTHYFIIGASVIALGLLLAETRHRKRA